MQLKLHLNRLAAASISPFCGALLRFGRSVILAHCLSPENLGVAIALLSILSGCDLVTDMGFGKFVFLTHDGSPAQVVAAARQVSIVRGLFLSAAILLFAPFLADLYGVADKRWLVMALAAAPAIDGFRNWRVTQLLRDYRYGPETLAAISGQLASVFIILPACVLLRDERVILASIYAEGIVSVLLSYALAPPERIASVNPLVRKAAIAFGLPLMLNGVGLLIIQQCDRMIISNLLGLPSLAHYVIISNLALTPVSILQIISWKFVGPSFRTYISHGASSSWASLTVVLSIMLGAAFIAIPIGLCLGWVAPLVYGEHYQVSPLFSILVMFLVFVRFGKDGPGMILVDNSLTGRLTLGNMATILGLILALVLGIMTKRIEGVLSGIVLGDFFSFLAMFALTRRFFPFSVALAHTLFLSCVVGGAAFALFMNNEVGISGRIAIQLTCAALIALDAAIIYFRIFIGPQREQSKIEAAATTSAVHLQ